MGFLLDDKDQTSRGSENPDFVVVEFSHDDEYTPKAWAHIANHLVINTPVFALHEMGSSPIHDQLRVFSAIRTHAEALKGAVVRGLQAEEFVAAAKEQGLNVHLMAHVFEGPDAQLKLKTSHARRGAAENGKR